MATLPSISMPFVDMAVAQTTEGFFDLVLASDNNDPSRDVEITNSLVSAIVVSLFTDRRARADEVPPPLKRRGWIGDLVSDIPGDRIGSGLWLYEQSRLTADTAAGVAAEAAAALQWMVDDGLVNGVQVDLTNVPGSRQVQVLVTLTLINGDISVHSFSLANATLSTQIVV